MELCPSKRYLDVEVITVKLKKIRLRNMVDVQERLEGDFIVIFFSLPRPSNHELLMELVS